MCCVDLDEVTQKREWHSQSTDAVGFFNPILVQKNVLPPHENPSFSTNTDMPVFSSVALRVQSYFLQPSFVNVHYLPPQLYPHIN